MAARNQILRTDAFTMSNTLPVPADGVPQQPQITSEVTVTQGGRNYCGVFWRGAEPAQTYVLSRSVSGPPYSWQTLCTTCADSLDQTYPFTDTIPPSPPMPPATAYYENDGLN